MIEQPQVQPRIPAQMSQFHFSQIATQFRALQPTPSGSLVSIIPDLNIVKARVHIHHDARPLKTQFLFWTPGALGSNRQETIISIGNPAFFTNY